MKKFNILLFLFISFVQSHGIIGQQTNPDNKYIFKRGSYDGIGKWYMGREIAHVMGFQGINWLERQNREKEENVSNLINNMNIKSNDIVADIGAGSGYHVFRIAPLANQGFVFAVDIQSEMLMEIDKNKKSKNVTNIETILGSEKSVHLNKNSVDKVLMVDVYHEFNFPLEMMTSIKNALKPNGQLFLIEYRGEDSKVPIKTIHKMTEKQAVLEMEAAGFQLKENMNNLPWQHCMIFTKK